MDATKPFTIPKQRVMEAFKAVKANAGAAGVDAQSIEDFEKDLKGNLFLGYTFRPRVVKNRKRNSLFVSFTPAVSKAALKAMRQTTRKWNFRNRTDLSLMDISRMYNPILRILPVTVLDSIKNNS